MTLTEFLLARIAEDEADCADLAAIDSVISGPPYWSTARYAAECKAKRRIVEAAKVALATQGLPSMLEYRHGLAVAGSNTLHYLAAVYADHPDYDPEWRP